MSFWNEAFYFEKRGDRYVYRPTVLSAGFDISESEKNQLFTGLKRLQWRFLLEGGVVIALSAFIFMTDVIKTQMQIPWFLVASVLAVTVLAITVLYRRDRLLVRVLGHRTPDVPRLALRQALAKLRPLVGRRYAIPVLRSVAILFGLAIALGDAFVVYLTVIVDRVRQSSQGPEQIRAAEELVALTVDNWQFWAAVVGLNLFLVLCVVLLGSELRRLRADPDAD